MKSFEHGSVVVALLAATVRLARGDNGADALGTVMTIDNGPRSREAACYNAT